MAFTTSVCRPRIGIIVMTVEGNDEQRFLYTQEMKTSFSPGSMPAEQRLSALCETETHEQRLRSNPHSRTASDEGSKICTTRR